MKLHDKDGKIGDRWSSVGDWLLATGYRMVMGYGQGTGFLSRVLVTCNKIKIRKLY